MGVLIVSDDLSFKYLSKLLEKANDLFLIPEITSNGYHILGIWPTNSLMGIFFFRLPESSALTDVSSCQGSSSRSDSLLLLDINYN